MIDDRVGLEPAVRAAIEALVARQPTLEAVVRWALGCEPPRLICDVVVQDEYTHDVIVPFDDELFLVYDTT